jgi:hypothetical protein
MHPYPPNCSFKSFRHLLAVGSQRRGFALLIGQFWNNGLLHQTIAFYYVHVSHKHTYTPTSSREGDTYGSDGGRTRAYEKSHTRNTPKRSIYKIQEGLFRRTVGRRTSSKGRAEAKRVAIKANFPSPLHISFSCSHFTPCLYSLLHFSTIPTNQNSHRNQIRYKYHCS